MKIKYSTLYFIRNIKQNAYVRLNGIFENTKSKLSKIFYNIFRAYFIAGYYFRFKNGKVDIPQIEFFLTSDCNLKCKHCYNYTPYILTNNLYKFDDFKKDLDKLLENVDSIQYLTFSGGEPFLHEELKDFIEYASSKRKIKHIFVMTNGTIMPNNKLINSFAKNKKKVCLYISDYSRELKIDRTKLKTKKLVNTCKRNKINYCFDENLMWKFNAGCLQNKRNAEQLKMYYSKCLNGNISCFDGKISPCPKATVIKLMDICTIPEDQYLDIRQEDFSKSKIIEWYYSLKPFNACDFCNKLDIEDKNPEIIPGEQLEHASFW